MNKTMDVVWDKDAMMAQLMDDESLARQIVSVFLKDTQQQIEILSHFLLAGDASGTERQAHSIKGASAAVAGDALQAVAFVIEKAAKTGDLFLAQAHLPELEKQFAALEQALRKEDLH